MCQDDPERIQNITAGHKMVPGRAYMEHHKQVASRVYRNIRATYGLEVQRSKWEMLPRVVENV